MVVGRLGRLGDWRLEIGGTGSAEWDDSCHSEFCSGCSRWIAKSSSQGLNLAIQAKQMLKSHSVDPVPLNGPALELHPVERAALAHYRLVAIHPFIDGNGRTARLVMNLLLIREG